VRIYRDGRKTVVKSRLIGADGEDETVEWDEDVLYAEPGTVNTLEVKKYESGDNEGVASSRPHATDINQASEIEHVMSVFAEALRKLPDELSQAYVFTGLLGYGGNGFVGEAVSRADASKVAVKFISKRRVDVDSIVPYDKVPCGIPLEADILRRCQHPNIVAFHGIFADEEYYYLVMARAGKLTWKLDGRCGAGETPSSASSASPSPKTPVPDPALSASVSVKPLTPRSVTTVHWLSSSACVPPSTTPHRRSFLDRLDSGVYRRPTNPTHGRIFSSMHSFPRQHLRGSVASIYPNVSPNLPQILAVTSIFSSSQSPSDSLIASSSPTSPTHSQPAPMVASRPAAGLLLGRTSQRSVSSLTRPRRSHEGDLYEFLAMYGKTPLCVIRHIVLQLVTAYKTLLSAGFLYLDFRSENILIDDALHITLVDFGMSQPKIVTDAEVFVQYGTIEASAPEIIAGNGYTGEEADVWALGLVIFLVCSGGEEAFGGAPWKTGFEIAWPSDMDVGECLFGLGKQLIV
jgi:hypothetical protein